MSLQNPQFIKFTRVIAVVILTLVAITHPAPIETRIEGGVDVHMGWVSNKNPKKIIHPYDQDKRSKDSVILELNDPVPVDIATPIAITRCNIRRGTIAKAFGWGRLLSGFEIFGNYFPIRYNVS